MQALKVSADVHHVSTCLVDFIQVIFLLLLDLLPEACIV